MGISSNPFAVNVSLSGLASPGEVLTATATSTDTAYVYAYQWQYSADGLFDDTVDVGSNSATYQVAADELGGAWRVVVSADDAIAGVTTIVTSDPSPAAFIWSNPNGGDWSDAASWSLGAIPGSHDSVAITLPVTLTAGNQSAASLQIGAGATLDVADGATFTTTGANSFAADQGTLAPTSVKPFDNNGLAEATNGAKLAIGITGKYALLAAVDGVVGPSWINEADGTISADDATLDLVGPFQNLGQIAATGSTVNVSGTYSLDSLGGYSWSAAGGDSLSGLSLDATSTLNLSGLLDLDTVDVSVSLASVGVGESLDATQGFFSNYAMPGNLVIAGGTVIVGAAAGGPASVLAVGAAATIHDAMIVNAGTLTINGDQTLVADGTLDNTDALTR